MSSNLFFRPHLGLGDHIICNGLLRVLYRDHDECVMPVKRHNVRTVERMFLDLERLTILPVNNDVEADMYSAQYKDMGHSVVKLGHYGQGFMKQAATFDESFYAQADVGYNERWNSFYYPHDDASELGVVNKLNENNYNNYAFVHDDISRGLKVRSEYLPGLPIIRPQHHLGKSFKINFFDYGKIIRDASEIHCMDSSFALLIDHMPDLIDKKKVIHRYIRRENLNPYYKNNWEILND